jgi:hypothetical protein
METDCHIRKAQGFLGAQGSGSHSARVPRRLPGGQISLHHVWERGQEVDKEGHSGRKNSLCKGERES